MCFFSVDVLLRESNALSERDRESVYVMFLIYPMSFLLQVSRKFHKEKLFRFVDFLAIRQGGKSRNHVSRGNPESAESEWNFLSECDGIFPIIIFS